MGRNTGTNTLSFINGFMGGMEIARKTGGMINDARDQGELRKIAMEKPEESTGFTAEQGEELKRAADSGQYNVGYDDAMKAYTVTPKADPTQTGIIAQQGISDFRGTRVAGKMDPAAVEKARQSAMADVVARSNPAEAMRMRRDVSQAERDDQRFAWDKAKAQDDAAERAKKAANQAELSEAIGPAAAGGKDQDAQATESYFTNAAPKVVSILVKQGRFDEAQKYQTFVESQEGRKYATGWVKGLRALSIGDIAGASKQFESLYNSQLFNDGLTAKFSPVQGKKDVFRIDLSDADGQVVSSQEGTAKDLVSKAALFLDPMKAVQFYADEGSKQAAAQALTDRQIAVEKLKQQGRVSVEETKNARQAARLAIRDGVNGAKPSGGAAKGPTVAQARTNAEIDAARRTIAEMDPEELRRKTAPTNRWGARNPDFDSALARASTLANRRKYGQDAEFEERGALPGGVGKTPAQSSPPGGKRPAVERFKADKAMQSYRLGKQTDRGFEVFDSKGKLIGHYD